MATVKLSRAVSAGAAINYAEGKNRLKETDRAWLREQGVDAALVAKLSDRAVARGGENVDLNHVRSQMRSTRELFGNRGKTQAFRVIQSFGPEDFNAADPAAWQQVNALGVELGRRIAPNHEIAVYTHLDGDGHKLHNHIIINAPNLITGRKYHHQNDFARVAAINDTLAREHGLSVIQHQPQQQERHTLAERKISAKGAYVWKDDLRSRIDTTMQDPHTIDFKTFSAALAEKGVTVHDRGQNVSYAFLDAQNKQRRARGPRLGTSYEKEAITHELAIRTQAREAQRLSEQEQQRVINAHRATEQRKYQTQSRERTTQQREPGYASTAPNLEHLANTSGHLEQKARSMGTHYRQLRQRIKTAIKPLAAKLQRFSEAIPRFAETISAYLQNQVRSNYVALKQKLEAELNPASKSPETPAHSETYQQLLGKIKENEAIGEQKQRTQAQQRAKSRQQQHHNEGPTLEQ